LKKHQTIPSHFNQLDNFGIQVMPLSVLHEKQAEIHRDDHYMFILQKKGEFIIEVDFNAIEMKGPSVCFVAPGQIHHYIRQKDNEGWFLFAEAGVLSESYRDILDMYQWIHQYIILEKDDLIFDIPPVLEKIEKDNTLNNSSVEHSLAESAIGIIVSKMMQTRISEIQKKAQKYSITRQFKRLITENFKTSKEVQQYARLLTITPLYLNEVVKEVTGYPASFWIRQKIILEARRLLFYTQNDVKQIAFELGYDDPVYFSRFFKKGTGMTALEFRSKKP